MTLDMTKSSISKGTRAWKVLWGRQDFLYQPYVVDSEINPTYPYVVVDNRATLCLKKKLSRCQIPPLKGYGRARTKALSVKI